MLFINVHIFNLVSTNPHLVNLTKISGQPHNLLLTWDPPSERNGVILLYTVYCTESTHGGGSGSGSGVRLLPEHSAESSGEYSGLISDGETGLVNPTESYLHRVIVPGNESEILLESFIPYTEYQCYVTANTSVGESTESDLLLAITDESSK